MTNPNELAKHEALKKYNINTDKRISAFLGVLMAYTDGLKAPLWPLNARMEALVNTNPKMFPSLGFAAEYHRQPEKIANRVYGNKHGNKEPGDGWKYRTALIGIAGLDNYKATGEALGIDFEQSPELISTEAISAAAWYWNKHGLNELADKNDFEKIAQRLDPHMLAPIGLTIEESAKAVAQQLKKPQKAE